MLKIIPFENYKDTEALYAFADLRGFGSWSKNYPAEIQKLMEITYSLAKYYFDDEKTKRLVKFLGDGFFSVNEFISGDDNSFSASVHTMVNDILSFLDDFNTMILNSSLHDKHSLGIGFGVTYGHGYRFHLPGYPTDYIGVQVNIASRLCSLAHHSEIVFEHDLKYNVQEVLSQRLSKLKGKEDKLNFKDLTHFKVYRVRDIYQELKKPEVYEALNTIIREVEKLQKQRDKNKTD